jgi:uncharacterized protein YndB with AHSA1/START domain
MSDDALRVSRVIAAPRERVFAAWIDADSLRRFMCPGGGTVPRVELEPRVGGSFRIDMQHQGKDELWVHTGTYLEVSPPAKLVFTWKSQATGDVPSLVTIVFLDRGGSTELVLTQERLPSAHAVVRHTGGWTQILELLERHLAPAGGSAGEEEPLAARRSGAPRE